MIHLDQIKIGELISRLRKEKQLTQAQLGTLLNISGKSVSKWERGLCSPDISILNELSSILGITTTELLNGEISINNQIICNNAPSNLKAKVIKIIFIIIIGIMTILITYIINNYGKVSIYNIKSLNNNLFDIEGKIICTPTENTIIINKIENNYKNLCMNTSDIEVILRSDKKIMYKKKYENYQDYYSCYRGGYNINFSEHILNEEKIIDKTDIQSLYLIINFIDSQEQLLTFEIPLNVEIEFINNEIVY